MKTKKKTRKTGLRRPTAGERQRVDEMSDAELDALADAVFYRLREVLGASLPSAVPASLVMAVTARLLAEVVVIAAHGNGAPVDECRGEAVSALDRAIGMISMDVAARQRPMAN